MVEFRSAVHLSDPGFGKVSADRDRRSFRPCQRSGQLAPVERAEQHLRAVEFLVGHASPLAVGIADHVGEYGMGVELRVEIARGVVARIEDGPARPETATDHRRDGGRSLGGAARQDE